MNFYLSAVDDLLKNSGDNPSIGVILCRSKVGVLAEHALRDMTKPIELAEYRLEDSLPDDIKTSLPTIEELEAELSKRIDLFQNVLWCFETGLMQTTRTGDVCA